VIVGGLPPVDCKTVRYRKLPGFNFSPGLETLRRANFGDLERMSVGFAPETESNG
jgi:hypothetical protein